MASSSFCISSSRTKSILIMICLILLHISLVLSFNFEITRFFPNETKVLYKGDALPSINGAMELINRVNYAYRVGQVISNKRVRLWDADTEKQSDFTTHFSFIIDTGGRIIYGSGLAFFLAPVGFQIPLNSGSDLLGLFNTTTLGNMSHNNQIFLVEFDSFPNPEWDPPVEHVGINSNTIASSVYTPWNASFHSGDICDVRINYNSSMKNLSVSWTYQNTSNANESTSLSYHIDLMKVLPEWVIVGISAATGSFVERHTLNSWGFCSTLDINEADGGINSRLGRIFMTVSGGTVFVVGTIIVLLMLSRWKQKRIQTEETLNLMLSIDDDLGRGAGPRRFSYVDLASATSNFSDERKLGEGGFGAVYKGYLTDLDITVAVKKISRWSKQGKKEYITEVKVISSLRHRNIVQLIGWCHDRGEFLLVYEFMPNGSLDSHLFSGKRKPLKPLIWALRYKISLGLASALLYLHEEWEQCVVHRDIKSSNVMLDSNFNVKLGDFGLARLMEHGLGHQTTRLAGTFGYLAPEYISTGRAGKESDVYSFGVVALEIVTGRRSIELIGNDSEMRLVEWIWDLYGKGKLLLGVDESLGMDFDHKQVECLMVVGLWCAHPDRSLRPSIRQAISVLNFETKLLPNLPTKMPVPMYHVPTALPSVSSGQRSITTSLEVGR